MTSRARFMLLLIGLVMVVFATYGPATRGVFVWDDHALIAGARDGGRLRDVVVRPFWTARPTSDARPPYYRPIVTFSYRFDLALADMDAKAFHTTNVGLHAVAAVLLALLARRLGASSSAAVLAASAWALAPRLTESVAWVSGRTDVLAGLASFAALAAWPSYAFDEPPRDGRARRRRSAREVTAALLLLVALLSKEVGVAAAGAIVVGAFVGPHARAATRRLPWIAGAIGAYVALRYVAMADTSAAKTTPLGAATRALTFLEALGRYVVMAADTWRPRSSIGLVGATSVPHVVVGIIALVALVAAATLGVRLALARRARIHRAPASDGAPVDSGHGEAALDGGRDQTTVAVALGVLAVAPVVHLVPIGLAGSVTADRLLYVPLAGLALALATAARRLSPRTRWVSAALAATLALSFVPVTYGRSQLYTDELLFRLTAAEEAHPENTAPRSGLAVLLRSYGALDLACPMHAATVVVLGATGRDGTQRRTRALENLAACLVAREDDAGAEAIYTELSRNYPDVGRIAMGAGLFELHRLDVDRAETLLRRAVELEPSLAPAHSALADLPAIRVDLIRLETPEARARDPVAWALLLTRVGRRADAIAAWTPLSVDPRTPTGAAWDAVDFLLAEGDVPAAAAAVDAWLIREPADPRRRKQRLATKKARADRVAALRPRLEALAR